MEHHASIGSLMLVVTVAFLVPILLHKFKLKIVPIVVAEIIAGIVLGKSGFDIIQEDNWLTLLSMFGLIYLMFLSGVEIDFSSFKFKTKDKKNKQEINPFIVSLIIVSGILLLSFILSYFMVLLGLLNEPYLMTIVLSTISLGIVVPVLKESKILDTKIGQTILLVAVISDFVTMILFAYYLAIKSGNSEKILLLLLLLVVVIIAYYYLKKFKNGTIFTSLQKGTAQLGTRGVFALILFFVALSESLGAENILGAFLAGVLVSLLSPKKEFIHQLDSFGYGFLIPIFFVMVGVNLDLRVLFSNVSVLLLLPLLVVFLYAARIIPTLILKKWFSWQESAISGVLLASTMSLAIVIASVAKEFGLIDEALSGAIILLSLISCLISPVVFSKFPIKKEEKKKRLVIVGANRITMPVSLDFQNEGYDVEIYTTNENKEETKRNIFENNERDTTKYPLIEIEEINEEILEKMAVFEANVIIFATTYDELNIRLAKRAKDLGMKQIIIRLESPEHNDRLVDEGFGVFSTMFSARMLLRAMVDNAGFMNLMIKNNDTIQEMSITNYKYNNVLLRQLPFLGDTLILQVYRGSEAIVPHGDTELKVNDRILVSGSLKCMQAMRKELEQ